MNILEQLLESDRLWAEILKSPQIESFTVDIDTSEMVTMPPGSVVEFRPFEKIPFKPLVVSCECGSEAVHGAMAPHSIWCPKNQLKD